MANFFPTFQADESINMMEMGITRNMYQTLQRVAAANHCVIMVRKTNIGSVMPFANRTAVGKKLATKGKSLSFHRRNQDQKDTILFQMNFFRYQQTNIKIKVCQLD